MALRMNSQFTATAEGSKIDQWFADEVAKATNGEVTIKIFWAGALGAPQENLSLLGAGAIDMAAMSPAYFPSDLPFFSAPNSLPMTMDNLRQASALMPRLTAEVPAFQKEAARHGIRPLFFHLLNPYLLMSRSPVVALQDLKGKKVRTWGEDLPKLFMAAGATPVNILIPEIYENLQHGVIDAVPFNVDLAVTYKIHEAARHVTEVVIWMGPAWGVWITEAAWNKISPENQAKITAVVERARIRELETTARAEKHARKALQEAGVTFHPFPAEELAKWKAASPDFYDDWTARMEKLGQGDDARKAVEIMRQVRDQFR
jgi:TRAP-type C4-dicarboxylate transport system substrate-binding protein